LLMGSYVTASAARGGMAGAVGCWGAGRSCGRIRAALPQPAGAILIGGFAPRFRQSTRTPLEEGTRLKLAECPRLIETHRYPLRR
jgi:hypothetical protein